jgi:hypothetical protein
MTSCVFKNLHASPKTRFKFVQYIGVVTLSGMREIKLSRFSCIPERMYNKIYRPVIWNLWKIYQNAWNDTKKFKQSKNTEISNFTRSLWILQKDDTIIYIGFSIKPRFGMIMEDYKNHSTESTSEYLRILCKNQSTESTSAHLQKWLTLWHSCH